MEAKMDEYQIRGCFKKDMCERLIHRQLHGKHLSHIFLDSREGGYFKAEKIPVQVLSHTQEPFVTFGLKWLTRVSAPL